MGDGVEQNAGVAFGWYQLAAEAGRAEAQQASPRLTITAMVFEPIRLPLRNGSTRRLSGLTGGQHFLGLLYATATVSNKMTRLPSAVQLAAEAGNADGQYALARAFYHGYGFPPIRLQRWCGLAGG